MPSGREKGPENSISTRRDMFEARSLGDWICFGAGNAASADVGEGEAMPGGFHRPLRAAPGRCHLALMASKGRIVRRNMHPA
eukprot:2336911-Pleurochrysis_carterae.AAC.6